MSVFQFTVFVTFIVILFKSTQYVRQYAHDINYDNIYISRYFRRRDERRKSMGKKGLLPLKKVERRDYILSIFDSKRTAREG